MGRMVSMLLWSTRSDLFPTRIRGTLQNAKKLHHVFTIRSTLAAKLLKEACFPIHQSLTLFRVQALKLTAFLMMILTHIAMVRKHGKAPKLKTTHYSIILITQGMILLHPGLILWPCSAVWSISSDLWIRLLKKKKKSDFFACFSQTITPRALLNSAYSDFQLIYPICKTTFKKKKKKPLPSVFKDSHKIC